MNNSRNINMTSDCGNYTISASLIADSDCYTQDNGTGMKCYKGSHWVVSMKCQGKPVNHIKGFHFGKYACGLCQYDMRTFPGYSQKHCPASTAKRLKEPI